ncbi:Demethylmenaquinone methyltransferase [Sporomusa ovata DSM 2662]|uniref:Methlytransferase, UbiE/COQ5 family n=1 Tax=Sporomusa ovata TaxID=2378 RepID=A0A0U1KZS6_9FIRM|nr:class I SAM-dependent methyltransferase [Sporomusa ovata]EQB29000.1 methylase involved in ubiquinone/menaquinone biosynthesis [Sporomusa ovata DSM 2662]CQR72433.1 Methlytransferase, UbiE/COQ5 family [Sporomusa ovata]
MNIDAKKYDEIAREVFAPIYPVIAEQIKRKTGIIKGTCLDVGCGSGYLGMALAKITDLTICFFDQSEEMLELVTRKISDNGLTAKARTLLGDVHAIPYSDQSIELVISRGSIFFWEDRSRAFREIYRVLTPGGMAFVGGGFGTPELKMEIIDRIEERNKDSETGNFKAKVGKNISKDNERLFRDELQRAGVETFEIILDDAGLWVVMKK